MPDEDKTRLCVLPSLKKSTRQCSAYTRTTLLGQTVFGSKFYQDCCNIVARDVEDAMLDFFWGGKMPRSYKATSLVLLPKNESLRTWKDFN